jgi:putative cardiolipin synthase
MTSPRTLALLAAAAAAVAGGCRSLPTNYAPPTPTFAQEPAPDGTLAAFAETVDNRLSADTSGFMLVDDSEEALHWRLALVDSATQSIDVQTYLWSRDFAGRLLWFRVLEAADRGVRVRVLVDDWELGNRDRAIAALDDHPNIEIRIWNPGRNRELGRKLDYVMRLSELNHRMHNKVFIADNRVAISGGRNLADEYFGLSSNYNMLDLDLLVAGPAVPQLSGMFDRYWNSPQAAPGSIFHAHASEADIPRLSAAPLRQLESSPYRSVFPLERRAWDDRFTAAAAAMTTATFEVVYDRPGVREPSLDTLYGLQRLFDRGRREILAINPYLVPSDTFFEEARRLEDAGVHLSIMTNSLGSTNQTIVNHAYGKRRRPMIEAGVDLFELRHEGAIKAEVDTPPAASKFLALHAKAVVVDGEHLFIGTYNFSPRSRDLNTEMGLLVHSPLLGAQLGDVLRRAMAPENSWRVTIGEDGRLRWSSTAGTVTSQPSQDFWRQIEDGIFGLFPVEKHL